jgi:hypothetical protein
MWRSRYPVCKDPAVQAARRAAAGARAAAGLLVVLAVLALGVLSIEPTAVPLQAADELSASPPAPQS